LGTFGDSVHRETIPYTCQTEFMNIFFSYVSVFGYMLIGAP
jgi:hypothetical protein